jgi:hypothetical protein
MAAANLWAGLTITDSKLAVKKPMERIATPPPGKFYHGVFPGAPAGSESQIDRWGVTSYHKTVGKQTSWIYFSHNWFEKRVFPTSHCKMIKSTGSVPYLRLMIRSNDDPADEVRFKLDKIIQGKFDNDLKAWARKAKEYHDPLIVEFGTDVNTIRYAWNAKFNGVNKKGQPTFDKFGDPEQVDGAEKFVAAYRHIINLVRKQGCYNITWVYHVYARDHPESEWNKLEAYYPGDSYIDWIGVSVYGALTPKDSEPLEFQDTFDPCYERIQKLSATKPVVISEFGSCAHPSYPPEEWLEKAMTGIFSQRWPKVIGFSWWNQKWRYRVPEDPFDDDDEDEDEDSEGDISDEQDDPNSDEDDDEMAGDEDEDEEGMDEKSDEDSEDDTDDGGGGDDVADIEEDESEMTNMRLQEKINKHAAEKFKQLLEKHKDLLHIKPVFEVDPLRDVPVFDSKQVNPYE